MASGQVLFQRFFYTKSFVRHSMEISAMACVCLASKIEEAPRRIRDVINVFHHIKQLKEEKPIETLVLDQYYINQKNQVIKSERRVLKELGFCVHVKHPHKLIVMFLQVLMYEKNEKLMQMSWNYMNDSLRTDVFMRHNPETVACACIYLTARKLNINLPKNPDWFSIFNVTKEDIHSVCFSVLNLYAREKPNAEALEKAVGELRKHYEDEKNKARSNSSENISPSASTSTSPNKEKPGSHNAWGGFISRSGSHTVPVEKVTKRKSSSPSTRGTKPRRQNSHSNSRSRSRSPTEKYKLKKTSLKRRSGSTSPYNSPAKNPRKNSRNKSRFRSRSRSAENFRTNDVKERNNTKSNNNVKRVDKYKDQNMDENNEKHNKIDRHERYIEREGKYSTEKYDKNSERYNNRHSEKVHDKYEDANRSRSKYTRSDRDQSRDRRR